MAGTYEYIVNRSRDFITLINRDYHYEIVNDAYCEAVALTRNELVGMHASDVWGAQRFEETIKPKLDECFSGTEVHFVDHFRFGSMRKSLHSSFYPYNKETGESPTTSDRVTHVLTFSHDITYLSEIETRLTRYEYRDQTTGLYNRRSLEEMLVVELNKARRTPADSRRVLMFVSLKNFKRVNQTYGHHIGDLLLEHTVNRIRDVVRTTDIIFRFSGAVLAVLLTSISKSIDAAVVAQKIGDEVAVPYQYQGSVITIESYMGIAVFPDDGADAETLIQRANSSSVDAEEQNTLFLFYDAEMHARAVTRMTVMSDLHSAIANGQLEIYYHPIVDITGEEPQVVGAEALIRWNHPDRGLVEPDGFIDIAEGTRLIAAIDKWALFHVTEELAVWVKKYDLFISINVSAHEFSDQFLPDVVRSALELHPALDPSRVRLELTERRSMDNPESSVAQMKALMEIGVDLWIDDFGTGQSSLTYLKQLPAAALKIDRTFVDGLEQNENDRRYLAGILESARARGKLIVIEGVTSAHQAEILKDLGCDYLQGYYYCRPLRRSDFEKVLKNGIPGMAAPCPRP
jgi:diguanylate cyclase (GGDEF)-like protein